MEAMTSDHGQKGGQEGAARRARAARHKALKFPHFKGDKSGAKQKRHRHGDVEPAASARAHGGARQAAGEAGQEQTCRLDRGIPPIEELRASRPSCRSAVEHGITSEEPGEHDNIAEEEDPEPKAHDDPLGYRATFAMTWRVATVWRVAMPQLVRVVRGGDNVRCGHGLGPA